MARTVDRFGRLDIVVNNAATALAQPLGSFTPEAWEKVYDVNLRGPVFLVQAALPYLTESPAASVVNVISAGAFLFSAQVSMYAAAKAALMSFTRSMAADFAPRGIRVNAIAPGTVDTDMVRNTGPESAAMMAQAGLMRRAADPDEMVGPASVPRVRRLELRDRSGRPRRRRSRPALTRASASRHPTMAILLGLFVAALIGTADFLGGFTSRRSSTGSVVFTSQTTSLVVSIVALVVVADPVAPTRDLLLGLGVGFAAITGISCPLPRVSPAAA